MLRDMKKWNWGVILYFAALVVAATVSRCSTVSRHVEQATELSVLPNTVEACERDIAAAESEIRAIQSRREQFLLLCSQYPALDKVRERVLREMDENIAFLKERIEKVRGE